MNTNSILDVCVKINENADGVVIGNVKTLTLTQGFTRIVAIGDNLMGGSSSTTVSGLNTKDVVVKTPLHSLTDSSIPVVTVAGTVAVNFLIADSGRDLQSNGDESDVSFDSDFSFEVELDNGAGFSTSRINMSFIGSTTVIMAVILGVSDIW
eukprot:CAMPEP_0116049186 /NCGR_PEP_ID=MMETSP0321-20121206/30027_1 /TAXON_ID=163516 /ORGANISM="Leptocylindrus danicus var. danicus, Strain B650" /LENGTH=151 /DNA_ID=CAMNT_0003531589 /DNA_START=26 /DNA_END=481 /DNA_ORIENTATION=-